MRRYRTYTNHTFRAPVSPNQEPYQ